jgi:hypothetical protein
MSKVLEIKELIISFYKSFDRIINPIGKFIFALITLLKLNSFLSGFGYNDLFSKLIVNVGIAVLAAFVPGSWFVLILIFVVAFQLFSISIEATIIITICMLVAYLLFVVIFPKMANLVIVVPLLASLKLGYVIPIFAGIFLGPTSIVAISVGLVVYNFKDYTKGLMSISSDTMFDMPNTLIDMYKYLMDALTQDKALVLAIAVFALVVLITYIIVQFEFDYVWYIAILAGGTITVLSFIIGSIVLDTDISVVGVILGTIVSIIICMLCQFMRFSLDYKRAEKVQFEDDDYYYYVKALPKIKIAKTEKEIKKIR